MSRTSHNKPYGMVSGLNARPGSWVSSAGTSLLVASLLVLLCGCESPYDSSMARSYYLDPHKDLRRLSRVALVELDNQSSYPEIAAEVTQALFLAVQKEQVFGVTVVRCQDPGRPVLPADLDSPGMLRQLPALRESLQCSGLLMGVVTEYQPYPHMVLGLRLKLLDLTDGQLLWGLEQVWDGADKSVRKRIETYFDKERRPESDPLREELVVVSSLNFAKFVAYEVARTLSRERAQ
jgi:hypothetical protein